MTEVKVLNRKRIEVTTTVSVDDAEIQWEDILSAVKVEPDEFYDTPWDNCDGWDHDVQIMRYGPDHDGMGASDRWAWSRGERVSVWLTLTDKNLTSWQYFHARGASKQVAHELAARVLADSYAQLNKWYSDGWEWWVASIEFKRHYASCGAIDDYNYAEKEVAIDLAHEVAAELEKDGYTVVGKPKYKAPTAAQRYLANRPYTGINSFNVGKR